MGCGRTRLAAKKAMPSGPSGNAPAIRTSRARDPILQSSKPPRTGAASQNEERLAAMMHPARPRPGRLPMLNLSCLVTLVALWSAGFAGALPTPGLGLNAQRRPAGTPAGDQHVLSGHGPGQAVEPGQSSLVVTAWGSTAPVRSRALADVLASSREPQHGLKCLFSCSGSKAEASEAQLAADRLTVSCSVPPAVWLRCGSRTAPQALRLELHRTRRRGGTAEDGVDPGGGRSDVGRPPTTLAASVRTCWPDKLICLPSPSQAGTATTQLQAAMFAQP